MAKDMMSPEKWASEWYSRRTRGVKDEIKQALKRWALKDFSRMIEMLIDSGPKTKMDVIELGCAPGLILKELYLLRPVHNYFGIDYSLDGLAITRKFLEENGIKAELIYADILTYVPDRTYDLVVSFGLVEHFDDPVKVLEAHKKFAAEDGLVMVSVPNYSHHCVRRALEKFRPVTLQTHNLNIMSEDALRKAFLEAGFGNIHAGGAVGPLLPTPKETPSLESRIYKIFSHIWNGGIRFIPPSQTWYGYYWAIGKP
jgi:SAM-dependent methyltransferase